MKQDRYRGAGRQVHDLGLRVTKHRSIIQRRLLISAGTSLVLDSGKMSPTVTG